MKAEFRVWKTKEWADYRKKNPYVKTDKGSSEHCRSVLDQVLSSNLKNWKEFLEMEEREGRRSLLLKGTALGLGALAGMEVYKMMSADYREMFIPSPQGAPSYTSIWCEPISFQAMEDRFPGHLRLSEEQKQFMASVARKRCSAISGRREDFNRRIARGEPLLVNFEDFQPDDGYAFRNWLGYFNVIDSKPVIEMPHIISGPRVRQSSIILAGSPYTREDMRVSDMRNIIFGSLVRVSGTFLSTPRNTPKPDVAEYSVGFTNVRTLQGA